MHSCPSVPSGIYPPNNAIPAAVPIFIFLICSNLPAPGAVTQIVPNMGARSPAQSSAPSPVLHSTGISFPASPKLSCPFAAWHGSPCRPRHLAFAHPHIRRADSRLCLVLLADVRHFGGHVHQVDG